MAAGFKFLNTRSSTGKLPQTVADCVERTGQGLHSGDISTVRILPAAPRVGRYFIFQSNVIRASIENALKETPLCTTLSKDGYSVRTVEHLLSALKASGVDNCRIEIQGSGECDRSVEVISSFD
ncbi:UNVERIFIED_CONTAM: putative UDP-3-O-acyl-N-acetylglucosamine deacetylase 1, mitochondrial [Sesamum indicum]